MSSSELQLRKRLAVPAGRIALALGLVVVLLFALFPYLFTLSTSFKTQLDLFDPAQVIPTAPTLQNYRRVFEFRGMGSFLTNSVWVAIGSIIPSLFLGIMAAYGLTRFPVRRRNGMAIGFLSLRMLPAISIVIPYFLLVQMMGLVDTRISLIVAHTTFNLPFAVWMLRGFFREVPIEIEEAALVDGATRWSILWTVMVPLIRPGIIAVAVFSFIQSWNELVFALLLTRSNSRTVPTMVTIFQSVSGVQWGELAAAAITGTLPVLIFAVIVQKFIISGLTFGAVK